MNSAFHEFGSLAFCVCRVTAQYLHAEKIITNKLQISSDCHKTVSSKGHSIKDMKVTFATSS